MSATPNLLTRREAAQCLRQSIRMLDMLIASGELPAVRIGRSVRIRPSAIDYFVSARESRIKIKVNRKIRA